MKVKALIVGLLILLTLPSSVRAASVEGFAKGRTDQPYAGVDGVVPLLSTFYFGFGIGGSSVDHHINSIMILPAGVSIDVSPTAALPPSTAPAGKISLMYKDKNGDDRYFFKTSHNTQMLSGVRRFSIRDVGCTGTCTRPLPPKPGVGSVFVLVGFELFFTGGRDHHVDEIAVFEEGGTLTVKLNDKNDDDVFGYDIQYAWLSPLQVRTSGQSSGRDRAGARVDLPRGRKVIRGFHFDFVSDDHHLREIGVLPSDQNLTIFYADKNGDDLFRWRVLWAILGPEFGS